eukprot:TRINITY_DN1082_c0_g1_i1.p1 TRINITY_DN1082_c0_g1~~TRINITY_DN1082_c0_g1_i1.p1  ORF type:complete len:355 (-),score=135.50 TRINITY_DN1082_c0_g1_i1:178-1242(-)
MAASIKFILISLFIVFSLSLVSALVQPIGKTQTLTIYGDSKNVGKSFIFPKEIYDAVNKRAFSYNNIQVTFTGTQPPSAASTAVRQSCKLIGAMLNLTRVLKAEFTWQPLGTNVLGQAGASAWFYHNNQAIPQPLLKQIANPALFSVEPYDISGSISSQANWYYGIDGLTTAGKYDLVSVMMHEILHGLGFSSTLSVDGTQGFYYFEYPSRFDYLYFYNRKSIWSQYNKLNTPSTALGTILKTPGAVTINTTTYTAIAYTPSTFSPGSSISHFDLRYTGTKNALMMPSISSGVAIHHPGYIAIDTFRRMGYRTISCPAYKSCSTCFAASPICGWCNGKCLDKGFHVCSPYVASC